MHESNGRGEVEGEGGGSVLSQTLAPLAAHASKRLGCALRHCVTPEGAPCLSCRLLTNEGKLLSQHEKAKAKNMSTEREQGEDARKQKKTGVNDGGGVGE